MLQYESKVIKSILGEGDAGGSGFYGASNFGIMGSSSIFSRDN